MDIIDWGFMIQIRKNIFETNSSSVHSITICTEEDFQQWKKGNLIWSYSFEKLIKPDEIDKNDQYYDEDYYITYGDFFDSYEHPILEYMETYSTHVNIGNQDIVAFGYYGHD